MRAPVTPSRCSSGNPVDFWWFGDLSGDDGGNLEMFLTDFEKNLHRKNLIPNEFTISTAKAEIRSLLERAMRGRLKPIKQIKVLAGKHIPTLFEIRWQNIPMPEIQSDGEIKTVYLMFRMYHSEPEEVPGFFIAHHIHEKDVSQQDEIRSKQNREIAVARRYFELGKPIRWGLGGLTKS
jgi:hypothetical protein